MNKGDYMDEKQIEQRDKQYQSDKEAKKNYDVGFNAAYKGGTVQYDFKTGTLKPVKGIRKWENIYS